jgi:hypothetical protein
VIACDWGQLAFSLKDTVLPIYTAAVRNVEVAGIRVGEMIARLIDERIVLDPSLVHIIGFSLGGHVAGQAGQTFQKRKPQLAKIGKITGII